jgi:hypothetical protein
MNLITLLRLHTRAAKTSNLSLNKFTVSSTRSLNSQSRLLPKVPMPLSPRRQSVASRRSIRTTELAHSVSIVIIKHRKLEEIKISARQPSVMTKSALGRLMEAERVAQQLKGAWEEIQREWSKLIVSPSAHVTYRIDVSPVRIGDYRANDGAESGRSAATSASWLPKACAVCLSRFS